MSAVETYDPDSALALTAWFETDEGERIEIVSSYHRRKGIKLPNHQLHAVVHVVVENQLALGEEVVVATLARLRAEGLSRHDAVHAIGSVLAENLYELMQEDAGTEGDLYRQYHDRLRRLTVESWRTG